jgi:vacuolar-type H+-ATPase subunit H
LTKLELQLPPEENIMAKAHISATNATDKTIRAIDRKRERERRFILNKARDNAEEFATRVTQRLIDREVLEINSVQAVRDAFVEQLRNLPNMEEFDIQIKVAPIRTLIQDPNILSLYLTGYVIEDLINNPAIEDIFGEDIDIYRAIDSIFKILRPPQ